MADGPQNTIAVVFDCDDTLAPDTTTWLLRERGIRDPEKEFWPLVADMVSKDGWDPPLAYMTLMIRLTHQGKLQITRDTFAEYGNKMKFFDGIPEALPAVKQAIENDPIFGAAKIRIEYYMITGGFEELISASPIYQHLQGLWGCAFEYDSNGLISGIKNAVSFTEKTRYLFNIQKGFTGPLARKTPYAVNSPAPPHGERPLPFSHMVYVGDGPSDVPCMSVIQAGSGVVLGINKENTKKYFDLGISRRANWSVKPDFTPMGDGRKGLEMVTRIMATNLALMQEQELLRKLAWTPSYGKLDASLFPVTIKLIGGEE